MDSQKLDCIVSRGHTRPLTEISFVEDGPGRTLLVSSAHDKLPQLRNGETGDWIGSFKGHKGAVWSCKVDKFSRTLAATASGDFSAKLWCVQTGKELHEFKHKHVVKIIDFSSDTEKIATGCQDGLMRIYMTSKPDDPAMEIRVSPNKVDESITKLSWLDLNLLLLGKRSGEVEMWDLRINPESGPTAKTLLSKGTVQDLEINVNHGTVLSICDTKAYFLSLSTGDLRIEREFAMPTPMNFKEEGGASLSPDGKKFLAGASDLWLREFDSSTGEVLRTIKGHHGPIRCVRYHPSGRSGASGSEDGTIRIWKLATPVSSSSSSSVTAAVTSSLTIP